MKIPINQINVGTRQRLSIGDLSDLDSMADPDVGQIQAILVHPLLDGYELVAGRRRLAKAVELGWTEIRAEIDDPLSEVQKQKKELFEDIGRTDRPWQDKCLSVAKIHYMLQRERRQEGETWTTKNTAAFMHEAQTSIKNLLRMAEILERQPKDEEAWGAKNFYEAYSLCVVNRDEKDAREELERRQKLRLQEEYSTLPFSVPVEHGLATSDKPQSQGQIMTPTSDQKMVIYLQGYNKSFDDAIEGIDYLNQSFYAIISLGYTSPIHHHRMLEAVRPQGFIVKWDPNSEHDGAMPWPLVWHQVKVQESDWPFSENVIFGHVFSGGQKQTYLNPTQSCISALPEGESLPYSVVSYTLKAICPPNMAVLCTQNAPVVAVAQCGHPVIWFEADKAKYERQVEDLVAYYKENIPGVEIHLR